MVKRLVLGPRANGDVGIFVSPAGVDADTAADSALVMNVVSKISQLILMGSIAVPGGLIALGLSNKPYVFVTSQWDYSGVAGHTLGPGPTRPSPMVGTNVNASYVTINSSGASMTVSAQSWKTSYTVYSQAF